MSAASRLLASGRNAALGNLTFFFLTTIPVASVAFLRLRQPQLEQPALRFFLTPTDRESAAIRELASRRCRLGRRAHVKFPQGREDVHRINQCCTASLASPASSVSHPWQDVRSTAVSPMSGSLADSRRTTLVTAMSHGDV